MALMNCGEGKVCNSIPKAEKLRNSFTSIYFRDNKLYEFNGKQNKAGLLKYMSADNWKESPVLAHDLIGVAQNILGIQISYLDVFNRKTDLLSEQFEGWVKSTTKKIPIVDRWNMRA